MDSTGSGETHGEKGPTIGGRVSGRPQLGNAKNKVDFFRQKNGIHGHRWWLSH